MNNSSITFEEETPLPADKQKVELRKMEERTTKILEALQEVQKSKAWSSLKELVLDGLVERLERDLSNEARKEQPDTGKLNRTAGKLEWAGKYADLHKWAEEFRLN